MTDFTGFVSGRLLVIGDFCGGWLCMCACGGTAIVSAYQLEEKTAMSCGCYHRTVVEDQGITCVSKQPMYRTWRAMLNRCYRRNASGYCYYGARGIRVFPLWQEYANFAKDMERGWFPGASLDRIDVNGHYAPDNCQWATTTMQGNNRRTSIMVTFRGETRCLTDWCLSLGLKYHTVYQKVYNGMDPVLAITKTLEKQGR